MTPREGIDRATDVVVVGATPGGLAAAIRAAREGLTVAVVERSAHIGGLLSGGLGVMDTQYDGRRAPIYDELCDRILDWYRGRYGEDSEQLRHVAPRPQWPLTSEPHVTEQVLEAMVGELPGISVVRSASVERVERQGRRLVALHVVGPDGPVRLTAPVYVDATYEADLAALAGVPYRVGRESREEFGEPHAGRIFTKQGLTDDGRGAWPVAAGQGLLNTRQFKSVSREVFAGSTGEGDTRVQAYSYRLTLSRVPGNRRLPDRPAGYDPELYRRLDQGAGIGPANLPNGKRFWFRNLPGGSAEYPDADEVRREEIRARHRDFALGYLYFLQHDETVDAAVRAEASEWGLALDEFVDNDNVPYELYVREARRIVGRYVFTEHDGSLAPGLARTPVHHDSIAFAEWPMDSHEVGEETQPGSSREGKFLLTEITRPSQIPFRAMLPQGLDNLLVPVCLSSTHVGWGTLRLEPVWMHVGEVAGWAVALATAEGVAPADVDAARLQRHVVDHGVAVSFFNDVDRGDTDDWVGPANILGTRGFFASYDCRPGEPLGPAVARAWAVAAFALPHRAPATAQHVAVAERADATERRHTVTGSEFAGLLRAAATLEGLAVEIPDLGHEPLTRGQACCVVSELIRARGGATHRSSTTATKEGQ